jgi:tRNA nucleotidyltransferase (CCA-adding enzyme)
MRLELDELLSSPNPAGALRLADECGLLDYMVPELGASFDFNQNNVHHNFTLGDHTLAVLSKLQNLSDDPDVRLAALLHDVGKPDTYWEDPFGNGHFYAKPGDPYAQDHEDRGADMAREFMQRLGYDPQRISRVENLIRNHMWDFYSTPAGARRFMTRAGDPYAAQDLFDLKEADLYGKSGQPDPEQLQKLEISRALFDKYRDNEYNTQ